MTLDRQRVREQFAEYTRNYNPEDIMISLKIIHTYKVADICEKIAKSLDLSAGDVDFCWLSGMLHDIGRFEQAKRYGTFSDARSVDHAEFGADLLFGKDRLIDRFTDDRSLDETLETVIREHNKLKVKEDVTGKTLVFCNVLRDADKVDIFRVMIETPMDELFGQSMEALLNSGVTPGVMDQVLEHRAVSRATTKTAADHHIGHIALAFELVYPKSREITLEQGYFYQMFDFPSKNETMQKALADTKREIDKFLRVLPASSQDHQRP